MAPLGEELGMPEIDRRDLVGSVLDEAKELGRDGAAHGTAVLAASQQDGRTRAGHVWHSPEGGIYLSVVLRPQVPMHFLNGLVPVCCLGVADALCAIGADVAAKWPDDVVAGEPGHERKLASVACEAGYGAGGTFAVCAVQMNVERVDGLAARVARAADGTPRPLEPAYLRDLVSDDPVCEGGVCRMGGLPTPTRIAEVVREGVVARVDNWALDVAAGRAVAGAVAPVADEWFDRLRWMNSRVEALLPDGRPCARGRLCGLDAWGRVSVELDGGEQVTLAPEQASLRLAD